MCCSVVYQSQSQVSGYLHAGQGNTVNHNALFRGLFFFTLSCLWKNGGAVPQVR